MFGWKRKKPQTVLVRDVPWAASQGFFDIVMDWMDGSCVTRNHLEDGSVRAVVDGWRHHYAAVFTVDEFCVLMCEVTVLDGGEERDAFDVIGQGRTAGMLDATEFGHCAAFALAGYRAGAETD